MNARITLHRAERVHEVNQSAEAQSVGDYGHGELMGVIAGELRSRGMNIREYSRGGILRELDITNPDDPGKGKVTISYDGLTTWEFWGQFGNGAMAEGLVNTITAILTRSLTIKNPMSVDKADEEARKAHE